MSFNIDTPTRGCGIVNCFGFERSDTPEISTRQQFRILERKGSAGFALCCFINKSSCYRMYVLMNTRYEILYQSPVRTNWNTDNRFFFCIFDLRSKKRKVT